MKRLIGVAIATGAIAGGIVGTAAADIKMGIIAPTTGPVATVGIRQLSTIEWWAKEVNDKGGIKGNKVAIAHCNDEGSPERAVTCARDLIAGGSVLLFGSTITGPIRAVMPLVAKGPVMLTPSPNIVPSTDSFVFQTSPTDSDIIEALAKFLAANNVKKIGMVAATDASGESGVAGANAVFPAHGIAFDLARIDLKATDASTQLARVARPDAKVVYSNYSGGAAATVVKSFSNLGLTQPLVVNFANISDLFVNLIRKDMPDRLLGTSLKAVAPDLLTDPEERARTLAFAASYKAYKGERADMHNLAALGMADTAEAILRKVKDPSDAKAVRDFLHTTPIKSFQTIRFSADRHVGMRADDIAILELKDGNWVPAAPIK
jgi:branched-chain amino acid transport system substrate-binding protein